MATIGCCQPPPAPPVTQLGMPLLHPTMGLLVCLSVSRQLHPTPACELGTAWIGGLGHSCDLPSELLLAPGELGSCVVSCVLHCCVFEATCNNSGYNCKQLVPAWQVSVIADTVGMHPGATVIHHNMQVCTCFAYVCAAGSTFAYVGLLSVCSPSGDTNLGV